LTAKNSAVPCYSYVRFSTPEQAAGDSLRRQTEAARAWCERNGLALDETTTLRDLGKSAFTGAHRKNPDRHALAAFLKLVEQGRVPRGSYLIIENLDRLTREDERAALRLWLDILDAGVNIVQLKPETVFRHERSDMFDVMRAIMELSRGHGESARKSERNGDAWKAKVQAAREGKKQPPRRKDGRVAKAVTDQLPAWIQERDGDLRLIPERAEVVRNIFDWAAHGYGLASIVKRLTDDKVPAWGHSGGWNRAYVAKILKDRRAVGEYQPRGTGRKPDGKPIKDFFRAAVGEAEWGAALKGMRERKTKAGRIGSVVNVFAGLLHNARDPEDKFFVSAWAQNKGGKRVLINTKGSETKAKFESFPADVFERAVFGKLREIDPHEILNGDESPDETQALAGHLTALEIRIEELSATLKNTRVEVVSAVQRLGEMEAEKASLAKQLADARHRAAHPLSECWGEAVGLIDALDKAADPADARLRLRAALRRIVDAIWILVVPRGRSRLAAVQIVFRRDSGHAGRSRHYVIYHRPPKANGKARTEGHSEVLSFARVMERDDIDLRDPADVRLVEEALAGLEVGDLPASPGRGGAA
jgi:DNA invertase Pin-like site-specific DNA recombinase